MNNISIRYLNIFLRAALAFGVATGVLSAIQTRSLLVGILIGFGGGLVVGLLMTLISFLSERKQRNKSTITDELALTKSRHVHVPWSKDRAIAICREAILSIKSCSVVNENVPVGTITAKAGLSWKSFGEIIKISVEQKSNQETDIEISSEPIYSPTIMDYGKNSENVEKICAFLTQSVNSAKES